MKQIFFTSTILAALAFSTSASAQMPSDGRQEASQICMGFNFPSSRDECLRVVIGGKFFDIAALPVCSARMQMEREIQSCLLAIRNKQYAPFEVQNCSRANFSRDVLSCFQFSGKPYYESCVTRGSLSCELELTLGDLRARNYSSVDERLRRLISLLN